MVEHRAPVQAPYEAEHVANVHERGEVTALYIPDPEQAKTPKATWRRCRDLSWWRANEIEAIGSIVRDGRIWHWEGDRALAPFPDGDPTTKREALLGLYEAVAQHFDRRALETEDSDE
ncbi:hypothetical protein ACWFMI_23360 [Nocardiopsis terrae]|uniref:hypothetical protein n=1 Tax=Streptomyces sp. NPDC057554 TaxID=3350538 RepID=UPI0036B303D4